MELYYQTIRNTLLHHDTLKVFPVTHGVYTLEDISVDKTLLYETNNKIRQLRCGFENGMLMSESTLKKYGSFIAPKTVVCEQIVRALQKMDSDRFGGSCLVLLNNRVISFYSYNCYLAQLQFHRWMQFTWRQNNLQSVAELYNIVESLEYDSMDDRLFAHKFILYAIYNIKHLMYRVSEYDATSTLLLSCDEFHNTKHPQ